MRRLLAVMHEVANKRMPCLKDLKANLPPLKSTAAQEEDSDFSDDESCYGPKPHCPAFFNSYSNGKCAVRTCVGPRGELPPLPAGVHGFVRDGGSLLYTLVCKGPGAPVVLHYANCGFAEWCKKYSILCKGHGTSDGAFSTTREGISEVRSHIATRQLALRGKTSELERFYKTFIEGNDFDEMAYFAQFGLVLRLEAPRDRLQRAWSSFLLSKQSPAPEPLRETTEEAPAEKSIPVPRASRRPGAFSQAVYEDSDALANKRSLDVARPRRHGEE